jgi:hypothetical protein
MGNGTHPKDSSRESEWVNGRHFCGGGQKHSGAASPRLTTTPEWWGRKKMSTLPDGWIAVPQPNGRILYQQ